MKNKLNAIIFIILAVLVYPIQIVFGGTLLWFTRVRNTAKEMWNEK